MNDKYIWLTIFICGGLLSIVGLAWGYFMVGLAVFPLLEEYKNRRQT
jgi:hypothetical protein